LKPIIKLFFATFLTASLSGCGGPAHEQGSYLVGEIGNLIFINHGCINEAKKNLEYCGDISAHFSAGWNTSTIVVDGSVNYADIQDVMSLIKIDKLTANLEIEFKQKNITISIRKDE
jgi:hypothetical protein